MKKFIAALLCGLMALSLAGCSAGGTIVKVDGTAVPNGVYLYYQMQAADEAKELAGENAATYLSQQIEGVDAKQWIQNRAAELCKVFVYVEKNFDEQGLSISDSKKNSIESEITAKWDKYSDSYTKNGISRDSLSLVMYNDEKAGMVYDKLFSTFNGNASEEQAKQYLDNTCVSIKYVMVPMINADNENVSAEEMTAARQFADDVMKKLNNGEKFEDAVAGLRAFYEKYGFTGTNLKDTDKDYITTDLIAKDEGNEFAKIVMQDEMYGYNSYDDGYKVIVYQRVSNYESDETLLFYQTLLPQIIKELEYQNRLLSETEMMNVSVDKTMAEKYSPEKIIQLTVNT